MAEGRMVRRGEDLHGVPVEWAGAVYRCKVSGHDNDGRLAIFEVTRNRRSGPVLHSHDDQDEWFYISDGEFLFQVGGRSFSARAGDWIFGPRHVPHAFVSTTEQSCMTIVYQPAGSMEEFYAEASGTSQTGFDEVKRLCQAHGMTVLGPPMSPP